MATTGGASRPRRLGEGSDLGVGSTAGHHREGGQKEHCGSVAGARAEGGEKIGGVFHRPVTPARRRRGPTP